LVIVEYLLILDLHGTSCRGAANRGCPLKFDRSVIVRRRSQRLKAERRSSVAHCPTRRNGAYGVPAGDGVAGRGALAPHALTRRRRQSILSMCAADASARASGTESPDE